MGCGPDRDGSAGVYDTRKPEVRRRLSIEMGEDPDARKKSGPGRDRGSRSRCGDGTP